MESGSADEIVSKMLWKSWSHFAAFDGPPKIGPHECPDLALGISYDVLGVEISLDPVVRSLAKGFNKSFWDSVPNLSKFFSLLRYKLTGKN